MYRYIASCLAIYGSLCLAEIKNNDFSSYNWLSLEWNCVLLYEALIGFQFAQKEKLHILRIWS